MKYEIKSIGLWSFVKLSFFLNLALGFVFGILYAALIGFVIAVSSRFPMFQESLTGLESISPALLLFILPIMMALFMAVCNTILGAIGVLLYNFASRILGGLEMTIEQVQAEPLTPTYQSPVYAQSTGVPPPPGAPIVPPQKPEPPASKYE